MTPTTKSARYAAYERAGWPQRPPNRRPSPAARRGAVLERGEDVLIRLMLLPRCVAMFAAAPGASTPSLEAPKCFSLLWRKPTTHCFSAPSVLMIRCVRRRTRRAGSRDHQVDVIVTDGRSS